MGKSINFDMIEQKSTFSFKIESLNFQNSSFTKTLDVQKYD